MTRTTGLSLAALPLRIAVRVVVLMLATRGVHMIRGALSRQTRPDNEHQVHRAIMLGSAAYIGLLALPYMPGAEMGLAMLAALGAGIAPLSMWSRSP